MVRMVAVVPIVVCAGWIIWRRWGRGRLPTAPIPSGRMPRELDPKLPYVVARIDEVE